MLIHQKKDKASRGIDQHGFTILETLISITIFSIFFLFFLASFTQIFASQDNSWKRAEASVYAQEGLEISYNIFTNAPNWVELVNQLRVYEVLHLSTEGQPEFLSGREESDGIVREIRIEDVFRSTKTGEIVATADGSSAFDPNTVLLKSRVEWQSKSGKEHLEYVTYITRGDNQ